MSVYIIEYLQEPSFISNTISKITGSRYSHSAMMIDNYWCELDAQDEYEGEPDYHVVEYDDIYHFLKTNPDKKRTVAFKVPHDFTSAEKIIGLDFWKNSEKNNIRYGYSKLFRFAYLSNFTPFLKAYYKWKKKPYIPIGDNDKYNVCSEAVGVCLRIMKWWLSDYNPKYAYLAPECTFPGTYAKCLQKYKVEV